MGLFLLSSASAACLTQTLVWSHKSWFKSNPVEKKYSVFLFVWFVVFLVSKLQQFTFQLDAYQKPGGSLGSGEGGMEQGRREVELRESSNAPFQQGRAHIWFSHSVKPCPKLVFCGQESLQLHFCVFSREGGGKQSWKDAQSMLSVTQCHSCQLLGCSVWFYAPWI